jgi:hypothetical protein
MLIFQIPIREGAEVIMASSVEAVDVDLADVRRREDVDNIRRREEDDNIRSLVQEVIASSESVPVTRNDALPPNDN